MKRFQCEVKIDRCYDDSSGQSDDYQNDVSWETVSSDTLDGLYNKLACVKRQEILKPGFGTIRVKVSFGVIEEIEVLTEQKVSMEALWDSKTWKSFSKDQADKAERDRQKWEQEQKAIQDRKEKKERAEFERLQKIFGVKQ